MSMAEGYGAWAAANADCLSKTEDSATVQAIQLIFVSQQCDVQEFGSKFAPSTNALKGLRHV